MSTCRDSLTFWSTYVTLLADGRGSIAAIQPQMFPKEWYPRPTPEYILRWQDLAARSRGTWVRVDIFGREMLVTVTRKVSGFIDLSRDRRCRRLLSVLGHDLDVLLTQSDSPDLQRQRSEALSRLDQGLGDLVRVVRSASSSAGPSRGASARRRGSGAAAASSSNRGK